MATTGNSPTAGELDTGDVPKDPHPEAADVSGDFDKQNPPPGAEGDEDAVEALQEAADDAEAEPGQTWAHYVDPLAEFHTRGLTFEDQRLMGVPEEALFDNSEKASYSGLKLSKGMWFTKNNRHRVDITGAHPVVLRYLEDDDSSFEVERY
jgi:hypothetical protein